MGDFENIPEGIAIPYIHNSSRVIVATTPAEVEEKTAAAESSSSFGQASPQPPYSPIEIPDEEDEPNSSPARALLHHPHCHRPLLRKYFQTASPLAYLGNKSLRALRRKMSWPICRHEAWRPCLLEEGEKCPGILSQG